MEHVYLFPFADYWWLYAGFTAFVLAMLALDLGVFHREAHVVTFKESAIWSAVWFSLALVLVFVGLKMVWLNEAFGGKFPITWSLGIIAAIIGTSIAVSLLRKAPASRAAPPAG